MLGAHEKRGNPSNPRSVREFSECIIDNDLMDVPPMGPSYTWLDGRAGAARVESRLDRAFVLQDFALGCRSYHCNVLARHFSIHHPIILLNHI